MFVHLFVHPLICIFIHPSICTSVRLYICSFLHLSVCHICLYVHLFFCKSIPLYIRTSVYLYICISVYLYVKPSFEASALHRIIEKYEYTAGQHSWPFLDLSSSPFKWYSVRPSVHYTSPLPGNYTVAECHDAMVPHAIMEDVGRRGRVQTNILSYSIILLC